LRERERERERERDGEVEHSRRRHSRDHSPLSDTHPRVSALLSSHLTVVPLVRTQPASNLVVVVDDQRWLGVRFSESDDVGSGE
jgi:hypothetical protein